MMQENLCLVMHCISREGADRPRAHRELHIPLSEVEALIRSLKEEGYRFTLPEDAGGADGPVCSMTFDDGYFNNSYFLEIAEKYSIPFILFLTSYNISHQVPFIWDIWEATRTEKWPISSINYRLLYEGLDSSERGLLADDTHRPFTHGELGEFARHPLVRLAPHGHTHQPPVGKYLQGMEQDIEENLSFLAGFEQSLASDFSLPCGFYTGGLKRRLLRRFKRIYTIDGGRFHTGGRVIDRISLISPDFGGPLREQIERSFRTRARLLRKALNVWYSNDIPSLLGRT